MLHRLFQCLHFNIHCLLLLAANIHFKRKQTVDMKNTKNINFTHFFKLQLMRILSFLHLYGLILYIQEIKREETAFFCTWLFLSCSKWKTGSPHLFHGLPGLRTFVCTRTGALSSRFKAAIVFFPIRLNVTNQAKILVARNSPQR